MIGNLEAYAKLSQRLAYDTPLRRVDAVYLHGVSDGMVASCNLFDTVYRAKQELHPKHIFANGSDGRGMPPQDAPGKAWPGFDWYRTELPKHGVRNITPTGPGLHTRSETDELVKLLAERNIDSVGIVTTPMHFVRSLSCLVASMDVAGYFCQAYYLRPVQVTWDTPMLGSQGLTETTLFEETGAEIGRIFKYWDNGRPDEAWRTGWSASPDRVIEYLEERDAV